MPLSLAPRVPEVRDAPYADEASTFFLASIGLVGLGRFKDVVVARRSTGRIASSLPTGAGRMAARAEWVVAACAGPGASWQVASITPPSIQRAQVPDMMRALISALPPRKSPSLTHRVFPPATNATPAQ